jgi:RNA polymerase sigma factor (sigma-70 family)
LNSLVGCTIVDLHRFDIRLRAGSFSQLAPAGEAGPEATVPAKNAAVEDEVALAELLDSFLGGLSERDRKLLEMKMNEDLTQGEIAKRLGLSDSVVSRRLSELHDMLVEHLGLDPD